jgi:tripartite-type tricarboxylate transporter receptor subunit TctC
MTKRRVTGGLILGLIIVFLFGTGTLFASGEQEGQGAAEGTYESWPEKTVKLIVPFSAGGLVDTFARGLQPYLSEQLGVPVIVEDMPGAGTRIGNEFVYKQKPDGYTILVANNAELTVGEIVHDVNYKTEDFTYIDTFLREQPAIVAAADSPLDSLQDLLDAASSGRVKFGHIGTAGFYHLQTLLIEEAFGVKFATVPYGGGAPIGSDIQGGHIDAGIVGFGFGVKQQNAGNLKVIGVCGQTRHDHFPDIPCVKDVAPNFQGGPYVMGLTAPPGLPDAIRDKIETAYQSAIASEQFVQWSQKNAMFVTSVGHEAYREMMLEFKERYMDYRDELMSLME